MTVTRLQGDCRDVLKTLPSDSVQCCITSPPYYGLRSYLDSSDPLKAYEIGNEPTLAEYIATMVQVFREVRRVLRTDGVCWLNLGDSFYHANPSGVQGKTGDRVTRTFTAVGAGGGRAAEYGMKPKDLMMVPHRVAIALQDDGWYVRSDCVWHKPNAMPESVTDRPTKAHEYVFLLSKNERYFYDADAIREPHARLWNAKTNGGSLTSGRFDDAHIGNSGRKERGYPEPNPAGRNKRSVWSIPQPITRLRDDLTDEQRTYVTSELLRRGLL